MKITRAIALLFCLLFVDGVHAADERASIEAELTRLRQENQEIVRENQQLKRDLARAKSKKPAERANARAATLEPPADVVRGRRRGTLVEAGTGPRQEGPSQLESESSPKRRRDRSMEPESTPSPEPAGTPPRRHSVSVLQENVAKKDIGGVPSSRPEATPIARDRDPARQTQTASTQDLRNENEPRLPPTDARGFLFDESLPPLLEAAPAEFLQGDGQVSPAMRTVHTTFKRVYLRKEVFAKNGIGGISDPAQITYVHPGKGGDSYAIDAGFGARWDTQYLERLHADWGLGAEYHRNTDASDRKNLLQMGLLYAGTIGGDPDAKGNEMHFVRVQGSTLFKNDNVRDFHAVAANLDVFPVFGPAYIDEWIVIKTGLIPLRWQPFAGLSYEGTTQTSDGVQGGGRFLVRAGIELEIFPIHFWMGESVSLLAGFTTRWAPSASGIYESDSGWKGYFHADLTYWFRDDAVAIDRRLINFGFGVGYARGDNPELGIEDQDLLTVSFKTKY